MLPEGQGDEAGGHGAGEVDVGGEVGSSLSPVSPCSRANQSPFSGSYTTKTFTTFEEGATATTWSEE